MNYPNYPQQYPQLPQQGYPPQYAPQPGPGYPPQYPQQGYGPQNGVQQAPPPPRAQWGGGAAFNAQPIQEKRPSVSFHNVQPGTRRTLVCDLDPVVIHGTNYQTKLPDYDSKGNPKWAVGTGFIDEWGQKVTHWCGKWSRAAQQYTSARGAVGLGPEDSMKGWVVFIQYNGDVKTTSGTDAKDYTIALMPIEQAQQYLSAAQLQTAQQEGVVSAEAPGNLKCQQEATGTQQQIPLAQGAPQQQPPMQPQGMPPVQHAQQYGPGQAGAPVPPSLGQPPQDGPWQWGAAPGGPAPAPGWPGAPQQAPAGMPMPPGSQQAPQAPYGAVPQGQFPTMDQAVHTVQQTLGGQVIPPPPMQVGAHMPTQARPTEVSGYQVSALAAYATMPDAVLASTGQDVNSVRMAIQQARQIGALPQVGGQQGQQQDPPF